MRGKLIVIEGTDCSGKETQTKLLIKKLREKNIEVDNFSFPNYNSPTGKIIGGPYLGKDYICDSYFEEGPAHVLPKVASLYYAADRLYNIDEINSLLEEGHHVILDRYVYSNMAHQGGKIEDKKEREEMYDFLHTLEFDLLGLPEADILLFLHMPTDVAQKLKEGREEKPDGHERDINHLRNAEKAYIEIAKKYNMKTIECALEGKPRSIESIGNDVYEYINLEIKNIENKKIKSL